jgi:cytochrome bd ubiquinol oxidase subunit I
MQIYRFWSTIFALGFGMGVVSGLVLSFEFGLAFSGFAQRAGPVLGPIIGLEVLTAFFLEAGFLGIMLFGWGRVGERLHFAATALVSLGTLLSASWILSVNSWMQHPVAYRIDHGRLVPTDWLRVIANPEWPYRIAHMLLASWIATSLFVAGIAAWYLLRGAHVAFARRTYNMALWTLVVLMPVQFYLGDVLADSVIATYQPTKGEAIEGNWTDAPAPAPWLYFVVPDQDRARNRIQLGIPYLGSILATHDLSGKIPGLRDTPQADRPILFWTFYGFRTMYLLGIVILGLACVSLWLRVRGRLFDARWFLRWSVGMVPVGFICIIGGWTTAETGRQPWVVYGLIRTADAVSPLTVGALTTSLVAFVLVYSTLFAAFCFLTARVIRKGPADGPAAVNPSGTVRRAFVPDGTSYST